MESLASPVALALQFRPIKDEDMPELRRIFREYRSASCDYSIGGLFMWRDYYRYEWAHWQGVVFIKGYDPESGHTLYYPPVGSLSREQAMSILRDNAEDNAVIVDYTEDWLDDNPDDKTELHANSLKSPLPVDKPEWDEYVYDINQFTGFEGKKMEKKRNHLNFFHNHFPDYKVEPIDRDNIEDVIAFTQSLEAMHADDELFRYENEQCVRMLRNYENTPMTGIAIRLEGNIIGYSFGEIINDMFFAHVEKGDIDYRGIYQVVASEMAKVAKEHGALYENREEDMGNEHLRRSKESYHPVMMIRKRLYPIL